MESSSICCSFSLPANWRANVVFPEQLVPTTTTRCSLFTSICISIDFLNFCGGLVVLLSGSVSSLPKITMKNLMIILSFSFVLFLTAIAYGQSPADKLVETIVEKDAAFWSAYNKCDNAAFRTMFTDDVEFYHDKGGVVTGHENFILALKTGLCSNPDSRLRREAVKGTVKVFPLSDKNVFYGAIIS